MAVRPDRPADPPEAPAKPDYRAEPHLQLESAVALGSLCDLGGSVRPSLWSFRLQPAHDGRKRPRRP